MASPTTAMAIRRRAFLTESSKLDIRVQRDREGTFDPKLIARCQQLFPGFDEQVVSMCARGMTGSVRNKAVYIALGVQVDGTKDILGLWIGKHRGRQVLAACDQRAEEPRTPARMVRSKNTLAILFGERLVQA